MAHPALDRIAPRDEREDHRFAVDRAIFGLLLVVAYRAFVLRESSWDLLALVVLGGVAGVGYRAWHGALSGRWATVVGLSIAAAALVAVGIVILARTS